jgi:hypothetical protein
MKIEIDNLRVFSLNNDDFPILSESECRKLDKLDIKLTLLYKIKIFLVRLKYEYRNWSEI